MVTLAMTSRRQMSQGGGGAESWRTTAITSGLLRLFPVDEGGHTCLPADLAIADVPVVDSSLGGRKTQFAGRWARPTPMGIIPTRSQRDDDDNHDDDHHHHPSICGYLRWSRGSTRPRHWLRGGSPRFPKFARTCPDPDRQAERITHSTAAVLRLQDGTGA